jgi:hypothetical protein
MLDSHKQASPFSHRFCLRFVGEPPVLFIDIPNGELNTMPSPQKADTDQSKFHGLSSIVTQFQVSVLCHEIKNAIVGAGLALSSSVHNQLFQAINVLLAKTMATPSGHPVKLTDNATIQLPEGLKLPTDNRTGLLEIATNTPVSLTTPGLNGLDVGSVAANSVYYLWIIRNPTTAAVGGLLSLSDTAPTLPSGFTQKQLYPVDFATNSSTATPRFIMKQLISHQEALLEVPFLVQNAAITSNASSPDTLNVSAVVGNNAVAITFEFWDFPDNLQSGQLLFYPATGGTYAFNTAEVIRLDGLADTNTSTITVNGSKTYKMARQNGLATTIKISKVDYLPLS